MRLNLFHQMIPNLGPYALVLESWIWLDLLHMLVPEAHGGCSGAPSGVGEEVEGDFRIGRGVGAYNRKAQFQEG